MLRLLFEKKGRAIWISHLDLMRLFQRAFKRAGLKLKHTQGFNPRPSVSIALPLSVGVESQCELLDFELDGETPACDKIRELLNQKLVEGVQVLQVYEGGRKIRDLALLKCVVSLEYDAGIPEGAQEGIATLFASESVTAPKKTKSGIQEQDLIPMIRKIVVRRVSEKQLELEALVCCQNPTLNPAQLALAIEIHLPQFKPDFSHCSRLGIYDNQEVVFR